jgi:hypothetical protein
MRGTILGVEGQQGVVTDQNQRRLMFDLAEWRSPGLPAAGQSVDFEEQDGRARSVYVVPPMASPVPVRESDSVWMGGVALGCLAAGFLIPLLPNIIGLILGIMGARRGIEDNHQTGIVLSRIGWIGNLVFLALYLLVIMFVIAIVVGVIGAASEYPSY